jgi:hypothetical protein
VLHSIARLHGSAGFAWAALNDCMTRAALRLQLSLPGLANTSLRFEPSAAVEPITQRRFWCVQCPPWRLVAM